MARVGGARARGRLRTDADGAARSAAGLAPSAAPVGGRVRAIAMQLGRDVQMGDVLCELDSDAQRLELGQANFSPALNGSDA